MEANMTIEMQGTLPKKVIEIYGSKAPQGEQGIGTIDIDINTPNWEGNRRPSASKIEKYLKKYNGFAWALFGSPLVAQLPNGDRWIYDGGHRVSMLQALYPDRTTFPGTVIKVKDTKEVARLFHRVNGTAASFVNNEVRFINEVLGEEDGIEQYIKVLEKTKVAVLESPSNYVPKTIKDPKWKINAKPMQDMVDTDHDSSIWALDLYTQAFGVSEARKGNSAVSVTGQIVKAIQLLNLVYKDWFSNEANLDLFEDWFNNSVIYDNQKTSWLFSTEYKHERMEKRHYGTALGIFTKFASYCRATKGMGKNAPKIEIIKKLYTEHDEKRTLSTPTSLAA
jgi:hypothetical protein|tara:strand:- start:577 stop:1587 length:1011 start_codon:yes stop_codon:yes gene_type:complete